MKILYDYQAFEMQMHGGVSRCFVSIVSQFPKDVQYKIAINFSGNIHLKEKGLIPSHEIYKNKFDKFFGGYKFKGKGRLFRFWYSLFYPENATNRESNLDYSIRLLKRGNFDVFHPTFFDDYFLEYIGNNPFVLTIHDMIPEKFPEYFTRDDLQIVNKQKLVRKAAHIIAVSENTKRDIVDILRVDPSNISVVYHGAPQIKRVDHQIFQFSYILYVGDRFGYKNFVPFITECEKIIKAYTHIKIVCTGKPFDEDENKLFSELNIKDCVIYSFVSSDDLYSLYRHAVAFVYPSLYEGFGIPILEAFACGCPVFLNNKSCFPEVAGDAAIYFEMSDGNSDFYEKFVEYTSCSLNEKKLLIEKGYKRLEKFSWKKAAEQYVDIYKSII